MNCTVSNQFSFKSRCPEVKLGQDVCNLVNREFPHISLTRFKPLFEKNYAHKYKIQIPAAPFINMIINFNSNRPTYSGISMNLLNDILDFAKGKSFNCFESAAITDLALKINGINSTIASVNKGRNSIDHEVCVFNKDNSDFNGNVINNKTIIVDTWAGICDFANNVFKEYKDGLFSQYFPEKFRGRYNLDNKQKLNFTETEIAGLKKEYPNLLLKKK